MKNLLASTAIATMIAIPSFAIAQESAKAFSAYVEGDVYRAIDAKTTTADITLNVSAFGVYGEATPSFNLDDNEMNGTDLEVGYVYSLTQNVSFTVYGQSNMDEDFEYVDTSIGVRARLGF